MLFGKTSEKHPQIYKYRSCKIITKFRWISNKNIKLNLQDIKQMKSELTDVTVQIYELTHP